MGIFDSIGDFFSSSGGGALGGAALGLVGGGISSALQAEEAKKARKFARSSAGTAWQRTVADMKAAGVNPIMAIHQGATPVGTAAIAQMPDLGRAGSAGLQAGASSAQAGIADKRQSALLDEELGIAQHMHRKAAWDADMSHADALMKMVPLFEARLYNKHLLQDPRFQQELLNARLWEVRRNLSSARTGALSGGMLGGSPSTATLGNFNLRNIPGSIRRGMR